MKTETTILVIAATALVTGVAIAASMDGAPGASATVVPSISPSVATTKPACLPMHMVGSDGTATDLSSGTTIPTCPTEIPVVRASTLGSQDSPKKPGLRTCEYAWVEGAAPNGDGSWVTKDGVRVFMHMVCK
jgi:hypothetical protein